MTAADPAPIPGKIAFGMVVGPQEAEMAIDTLEGVASFYPKADLWVRDDRTSDGTWEKLEQWAQGRSVHLTRNETVQGYFGIANSYFSLLQAIMANGQVPEMVIKIDPDAILLRPGVVEIFQRKFSENGPGICGSYKIAPDGSKRRVHMLARNMLLDLLPIGKTYRGGFRAKPVSYRKYLFQALRHGYSMGEHVLGAVSACHGSTVVALHQNGFLTSIIEGPHGLIREEDILISLGARAIGHKLMSLNEFPNGVVAWLRAFRPLGITAEEAWARHYLAVHPIKKVDDEMRQFFRKKRLPS